VSADYKYHSELVTKFINNLMKKGKKSVAEKIFYEAIDLITERTGKEGIDVFNQALNNVKPMVEVRPKRIGGQTYQVPIEVRASRKLSLAIKWLVEAARSRGAY
jgi:small subunit ribosomal protein S7